MHGPKHILFWQFSDLTITWCMRTLEYVGCLDTALDFYSLEIKWAADLPCHWFPGLSQWMHYMV